MIWSWIYITHDTDEDVLQMFGFPILHHFHLYLNSNVSFVDNIIFPLKTLKHSINTKLKISIFLASLIHPDLECDFDLYMKCQRAKNILECDNEWCYEFYQNHKARKIGQS